MRETTRFFLQTSPFATSLYCDFDDAHATTVFPARRVSSSQADLRALRCIFVVAFSPAISVRNAIKYLAERIGLLIIDEFASGPVIFVGHSVSAMIGLLATIEAPDRFLAQLMIGPSPCYVNDGEYVGGFDRADIDDLLNTVESNYLGWSSAMAPAIMGAPDQPQLGIELTNSFCRTNPDIAKHFARVTFLSDHRADLPKSQVPALIVQCSDDLIAPVVVGEYMHRVLPRSTLSVIENVGHCPHLSSPSASSAAMENFLASLAR